MFEKCRVDKRDFSGTCLNAIALGRRELSGNLDGELEEGNQKFAGPEQIRAIREREHVSQPVFAAYLNVSRNLVSDWERGVKRPGGPALRLLSIIQRKGLQAVA